MLCVPSLHIVSTIWTSTEPRNTRGGCTVATNAVSTRPTAANWVDTRVRNTWKEGSSATIATTQRREETIWAATDVVRYSTGSTWPRQRGRQRITSKFEEEKIKVQQLYLIAQKGCYCFVYCTFCVKIYNSKSLRIGFSGSYEICSILLWCCRTKSLNCSQILCLSLCRCICHVGHVKLMKTEIFADMQSHFFSCPDQLNSSMCGRAGRIFIPEMRQPGYFWHFAVVWLDHRILFVSRCEYEWHARDVLSLVQNENSWHFWWWR